MKTSELIKELKNNLKEYGDLEVYLNKDFLILKNRKKVKKAIALYKFPNDVILLLD